MPAELRHPLAVHFVLPGQRPYLGTLHELPDAVLATDIAQGLISATHPVGPIRTYREARHAVRCARHFARHLSGAGFRGSLSDLTPAQVTQYWLASGFTFERHSRIMLTGYRTNGGQLHAGIQAHLDGRSVNRMRDSTPNRPYSEAQWRRLDEATNATITTAWRDHRNILETADRGADPATHGITFANLAWMVHRTGPLTAKAIRTMILAAPTTAEKTIAEIRSAFYPTAPVALAYNLRLAMLTGIVPDGIDALTCSNLTRTGPSNALLSYFKGRTGRESLNINGPAVRLLDQWLKHSALLREHAADIADDMWIHYSGRHGLSPSPRTPWWRARWAQETGLLDDNGQPLVPHSGRIRATYHHRRDRSAWTGRTTIDPNHTPTVEGDHYLAHHTPAQVDAIEGIIEDAQRDIRRKAEPPAVVTHQDAARFVADFPHLASQSGLDADAIKRLLAGEQDVYLASCTNPYNSPHAPAGTLCPARPWVCLLCPLAVFAPRHLPNLLRLKNYFSAQARNMTTPQFLAVFGPYADRLDADVLPRFSLAAIRAATDTAFAPLHPEEAP
ncbi:hypothetical protein [Streptomyces sp. NPDC048385]|uniref:hypothetical protein n=1 Tax=unclassified Streptomyces TaxID=2593676 RepID=UPI003425A4CD